MNDVGDTWTDVHYKETNNHDYLNFNSHHPDHTKKNIPYVLAKRIIVFTTKDEKVRKNLEDLRKWLQKCEYPIAVINKGIHDAKLQGPAPLKNESRIIPLISTYYSNFDNNLVLQMARQLIDRSKNERVQNAFKNTKLIQAYRQPKNILRTITNSKFITQITSSPNAGLTKCKDKRCDICKIYIKEESSFMTANWTNWKMKCNANCQSLNVLYYLVCNFCKITSYIGKTGNLRERHNNHVTGCRYGKSSNQFDRHVNRCAKMMKMDFNEPFFELHILMTVNDYDKLLSYEFKLHSKSLDTMNR